MNIKPNLRLLLEPMTQHTLPHAPNGGDPGHPVLPVPPAMYPTGHPPVVLDSLVLYAKHDPSIVEEPTAAVHVESHRGGGGGFGGGGFGGGGFGGGGFGGGGFGGGGLGGGGLGGGGLGGGGQIVHVTDSTPHAQAFVHCSTVSLPDAPIAKATTVANRRHRRAPSTNNDIIIRISHRRRIF